MTRFSRELSTCETPASVAEWVRRGTPRTTLIGPHFTRTAYGCYRRAGSPPSTAQRILEAAAGLPDGALIAGWAATYVHGVDQLDGFDDHTFAPLPVPVLLPPGQRRRTTEGVSYRQSRRRARREEIEGVAATSGCSASPPTGCPAVAYAGRVEPSSWPVPDPAQRRDPRGEGVDTRQTGPVRPACSFSTTGRTRVMTTSLRTARSSAHDGPSAPGDRRCPRCRRARADEPAPHLARFRRVP